MNDQRKESPPSEQEQASPATTHRKLMRRVALIDGIGVLFVLALAALWYAADVLLLLFACVLCAVLLQELSEIVQRRLGISRKLGLAVVVLLLLLILGLGSWLMAPQISDQSSKLAETVPKSLQRLREVVAQHPLLERIVAELPSPEQVSKQLASLIPNAGLFFGGLVGAIVNVVIILFVGIYFAASPTLYIEGFIKLIPQGRRTRIRDVLHQIGRTLARWLIGKSLSMLIVGVLTASCLSLLGVPLALILGIIAGLLDFIPYFGLIMADVPAVLIAFSISPHLALYTILLLTAIQLAEGYVLLPMIEAKTVSLPPALTIVMQLLFGSLFGFAGVALATPLTAALSVLVGTLYVQDVLGERRGLEA